MGVLLDTLEYGSFFPRWEKLFFPELLRKNT
jgi:hypothetical protein